MNVCECGCGGETKSRFVRGHHRRVPGAKPPRAAQSLDQRIRDNSEVTEDGHWLWQRRIDQSGYGQIKVNKRTRPVARVSHEVFIGEVPAGHIVHQTCGRRDCVAPEHLEAITFAEMNHRGENDALKNFAEYYERRRAATHCPNGHPWDEENTRRDEVQRYCRSCLRDSQRERRLDPAFRALEQSRARDLYVENREQILTRKREWYSQNREHVAQISGARRRASYAAAKAEGRCAFGSGYGCNEPAHPERVMCADHQQIQNERNWVHTTESLWDSYFERGLTGDQCWLCGGEIAGDDILNHDHLHPFSSEGRTNCGTSRPPTGRATFDEGTARSASRWRRSRTTL